MEQKQEQEQKRESNFLLVLVLVLYLLGVGVGAAAVVIINFPTETDTGIVFPKNAVVEEGEDSQDIAEETKVGDEEKPIFVPFGELGSAGQGLLLLAFLSGIAGSFLYAAQSLSSYVGNKTFKASWFTWYLLRPWVGGLLGFALYAAIRAGLVAGTGAVNPYGVVALGLLGGWFSKTTTDKLQEVYQTLFQTKQDEQRQDKLGIERPVITGVEPPRVPRHETGIIIRGENFLSGAFVQINDVVLSTEFISESELKVRFGETYQRPVATEAVVRVKNPKGPKPLSEDYKIEFE